MNANAYCLLVFCGIAARVRPNLVKVHFYQTTTGSPGSRFIDSVRTCVIAEVAGQTPSSSKVVDNMFTTAIKKLVDDDGETITEDVGEDFFREIIMMYTVPADTVMSVHPSSRK